MARSSPLTLVFALAAALVTVLGCSLNPFAPKRVKIFPPAAWRNGPPIASMDFYALMISGNGVANSLRASDVGNRSLSCLGFTGTVYFPQTFDQLTSGISLSLPAGTYTFTFVGFSNSGTLSPATVRDLFVASPSLKAFTLASSTSVVSSGGSVSTTATYDESTAPELIAGCPPSSSSVHLAVSYGTAVEYVKYNPNTAITFWDTVENSHISKDTNLLVDDSGIAHLTYADPTSGYGVRYATNSSGTFLDQLAAATTETFGLDYSGIASTANGNLHIVTNDQTGSPTASAYLNLGSGFIYQTRFFSVTSGYYKEFRLVANGNELFAAAHELVSSTPLRVTFRSAAGLWGTTTSITTAGPTSCDTNTKNVIAHYAPNGTAHVVYRCNYGGGPSIGYASNASGSWVTKKITDDPTGTLQDLAFAIDGGGTLYVTYNTGTSLFYVTGNSNTGVFSAPNPITTTSGSHHGMELVAVSPVELYLATVERELTNDKLYLYKFSASSWSKTELRSYGTGANLAKGLWLK